MNQEYLINEKIIDIEKNNLFTVSKNKENTYIEFNNSSYLFIFDKTNLADYKKVFSKIGFIIISLTNLSTVSLEELKEVDSLICGKIYELSVNNNDCKIINKTTSKETKISDAISNMKKSNRVCVVRCLKGNINTSNNMVINNIAFLILFDKEKYSEKSFLLKGQEIAKQCNIPSIMFSLPNISSSDLLILKSDTKIIDEFDCRNYITNEEENKFVYFGMYKYQNWLHRGGDSNNISTLNELIKKKKLENDNLFDF